jgi:hypothetical protein
MEGQLISEVRIVAMLVEEVSGTPKEFRDSHR